MLKLLVLLVLLFTNLFASHIVYKGLFATITNVASDDTLSVRVKPNWRSRKITELPPNELVGVDECIKSGRSTWCKVHNVDRNIGQYHEYGEKLPGWVNARYLKFTNHGYVAINGKKHCDYAISCDGGKCKVVTNTTMRNGNVIAIKIKNYSRSSLKGIGELNIPSGSEGYPCNRVGGNIEIYLEKHPNKSLALGSKVRAKQFLKALQSQNITQIKKFIHPTLGITVTNKLSFSEFGAKHLSKNAFVRFYQNRHKLNWGRDYAKGEIVKISLKKLMLLKYPANRVSKVSNLANLKHFKPINGYILKGYEFFWKGVGKEANYNWLGADIILSKKGGKWYVVGFLWNRWTI